MWPTKKKRNNRGRGRGCEEKSSHVERKEGDTAGAEVCVYIHVRMSFRRLAPVLVASRQVRYGGTSLRCAKKECLCEEGSYATPATKKDTSTRSRLYTEGANKAWCRMYADHAVE